jgi:hypothetical protein
MDWTAEELHFYSRLGQRLLSSTKLQDMLKALPTVPPRVASYLGEKFFVPPAIRPQQGRTG